MRDLESVRASVEILQYVKARRAELKELEERHRPIVEEVLGNDEIGRLNGKTVVTYKHIKSRRLNQQTLKTDYPDVAEHCTETVESRRFEVK